MALLVRFWHRGRGAGRTKGGIELSSIAKAGGHKRQGRGNGSQQTAFAVERSTAAIALMPHVEGMVQN
jgi:hypothetical protein